jgi:hypothetical protein
MGELFGVVKSTVSEHLNHIFESGELEKNATVRNFQTVQIFKILYKHLKKLNP